MSKLFGKAGLNGPSHGNFPKTPLQSKPDFGNDQTQNNKSFSNDKNINIRRKHYAKT